MGKFLDLLFGIYPLAHFVFSQFCSFWISGSTQTIMLDIHFFFSCNWHYVHEAKKTSIDMFSKAPSLARLLKCGGCAIPKGSQSLSTSQSPKEGVCRGLKHSCMDAPTDENRMCQRMPKPSRTWWIISNSWRRAKGGEVRRTTRWKGRNSANSSLKAETLDKQLGERQHPVRNQGQPLQIHKILKSHSISARVFSLSSGGCNSWCIIR